MLMWSDTDGKFIEATVIWDGQLERHGVLLASPVGWRQRDKPMVGGRDPGEYIAQGELRGKALPDITWRNLPAIERKSKGTV